MTFFPVIDPFYQPFWDCSPVLGTKCSELEWFIPETGLPFLFTGTIVNSTVPKIVGKIATYIGSCVCSRS